MANTPRPTSSQPVILQPSRHDPRIFGSRVQTEHDINDAFQARVAGSEWFAAYTKRIQDDTKAKMLKDMEEQKNMQSSMKFNVFVWMHIYAAFWAFIVYINMR